MGLFDWLSGLFSSNDSENNIEGGISKEAEDSQSVYVNDEVSNQVSNLEIQDEHEAEVQTIAAITTEVDVSQDSSEIQESNLS